jgi:hypothetical protein
VTDALAAAASVVAVVFAGRFLYSTALEPWLSHGARNARRRLRRRSGASI